MRSPSRPTISALLFVAVALVASACGDATGEGEASGSVTKDTTEVSSSDSSVTANGEGSEGEGSEGNGDGSGGDETTTSTTSEDADDTTTSSTGDAIEPLLAPGTTTCWSGSVSDQSLADLYRLVVGSDGVSVELTSWLIGDFDVTEAIESGSGAFVTDTDLEVTTSRWTPAGTTSGSAQASVGVDGLTIDGGTVASTSCDEVDALTAGPVGLTIRVDEEIRFATGAVSGSVDGAVIRGERDRYFFEAGDGQTATMELSSLEDNGVFDLYGPTGELLASEATNVSLVLPQFGDYVLIVGGIRGNVSYTFDLEIVS